MGGRLVNMEIQKTEGEMGGGSIPGEYTQCCISWVSLSNSAIRGEKNFVLNILSCCRGRACLSESRKAGGFGRPMVAPEAAVKCWHWRYVPSAEEKLTGKIDCVCFMWTNQSCLQPGSRSEQTVSGCGPLTKQQPKYISNRKPIAFTLSAVEGSRCVGCRRSLTEPWTCRPKLNHNQSLSEVLSASKHNRDYVCPSAAAAELRCIVTMSCSLILTGRGSLGCLLVTACNLFKSTQTS